MELKRRVSFALENYFCFTFSREFFLSINIADAYHHNSLFFILLVNVIGKQIIAWYNPNCMDFILNL